MLEISGLRKSFPSMETGGAPVEIVRVPAFSLAAGEQVALRGRHPERADHRELARRLNAIRDHERAPAGGEVDERATIPTLRYQELHAPVRPRGQPRLQVVSVADGDRQVDLPWRRWRRCS